MATVSSALSVEAKKNADSQVSISSISRRAPTFSDMLDIQFSEKRDHPKEVNGVLFSLQRNQEIIEINGRRLEAKQISEIIEYLKINVTRYNMITFFDCDLTLSFYQDLFRAFLTKETVISLHFNNCELSEEQIKQIADIPLKALNFSGNIEAIEKLLKMLSTYGKCRNSLQYLQIQGKISSLNIKDILEQQTLETLHLRNSQIHLKDLLILLDAKNLRSIYIEDQTALKPEDLVQIELALENNKYLFNLVLPDDIRSQWDVFKAVERNLNNHPQLQLEADRYGKKRFNRTARSQMDYFVKIKDLLYRPILTSSDIEKINKELQAFVNPNMYDDESYHNPLVSHFIINECHKAATHFLRIMSDTLDPNQRDRAGKTVLIMAAQHFSAFRELEVLLSVYADRIEVNAQDMHGRSALHYLCLYGRIEQAIKLVSLGANPYLKDIWDLTPLDCLSAGASLINKALEEVAIIPERDVNASMNAFQGHYISYDKEEEHEIGLMNFPSFSKKIFESFNPIDPPTTSKKANIKYIRELEKDIPDSEASFPLLKIRGHAREAFDTWEKEFLGISILADCMSRKTPDIIATMTQQLVFELQKKMKLQEELDRQKCELQRQKTESEKSKSEIKLLTEKLAKFQSTIIEKGVESFVPVKTEAQKTGTHQDGQKSIQVADALPIIFARDADLETERKGKREQELQQMQTANGSPTKSMDKVT